MVCLCHIVVCQCVFVCAHLAIWIYMWSVVCLCVCACARSLSHMSTWRRVCVNVIACVCVCVCEPVGSLPVVCSWRYAYGETETSSGAPLPLLWWKAALIEWPGTQPPFLIITAVQSLLITLKVCRAPHSPVMLQAIRESERKIRRFWQNPLSKKLKRVEKGAAVKAV